MKATRFALATSAMTLLGTAPAMAQTSPCTATQAASCYVAVTASATVGDMLELTLSSTATALGDPTVADFNTGYKTATGPVSTVKANRNFSVAVQAASANFTAPWSKPAGDLKWNNDGTATYGNNAGASATLFSGAPTNTSTKTIYLKTIWTYASDAPGAYSLVLNFTLSAP